MSPAPARVCVVVCEMKKKEDRWLWNQRTRDRRLMTLTHICFKKGRCEWHDGECRGGDGGLGAAST